MGDRTPIEWADATWNPVTGCDRCSPGCDNCYAATLAARLKAMGNPRYQSDGNPPLSGPGFGVACHEDLLAVPQRWVSPRRVFVCSMSDLFHPDVKTDFIRRVFAAMVHAPQHQYLVLTKRPGRLALLSDSSAIARRPNIHLGVSVEDAEHAWRVGTLCEVDTPGVLWVSAEPLLGPLTGHSLEGIGWVVCGGESGPGFRPPDPDWVRELRDGCAAAGVPFFFKQWGGRTAKAGGRLLDGAVHDAYPPQMGLPSGG